MSNCLTPQETITICTLASSGRGEGPTGWSRGRHPPAGAGHEAGPWVLAQGPPTTFGSWARVWFRIRVSAVPMGLCASLGNTGPYSSVQTGPWSPVSPVSAYRNESLSP